MSGVQTQAIARGAASAEIAATRRLLYVEDDTQIAEIACMMLEDTPLDVTRAGSAEEAMDLLGESNGPPPFDIVLTDVVMRGLSGVRLAQQLSRRWPTLPVVLVSGYSEELATGYGANFELLRKPFTRGALIDSLQRHLDASLDLDR